MTLLQSSVVLLGARSILLQLPLNSICWQTDQSRANTSVMPAENIFKVQQSIDNLELPGNIFPRSLKNTGRASPLNLFENSFPSGMSLMALFASPIAQRNALVAEAYRRSSAMVDTRLLRPRESQCLPAPIGRTRPTLQAHTVFDLRSTTRPLPPFRVPQWRL